MKNLPLFRPFLWCLFGFLLQSTLVASGGLSSGSSGSKAMDTETGVNTTSACSTPTWPTTSNITQSSATFSWDAVSGALSYSVQTRVPNGTWYTVPGSPFNSTSATVDWFLPNTTYEWRVRANCYGGEYSYWTYPVTFTTSGWGYCNTPSWLYTNNVTQTSATFDWEPVSGAYSYSLQYRLAGGTWYDIPGTFNQTWYTINGLQPGTTYEWRVRTNCANWMYSSWSYPATFTTLGYSCYHPYWLYTSNITQHSATFNWDHVSGAVSYTIQLKAQGGNWYDLPGPIYGVWYTATGLQPGTCYEWRVRANCSNWSYSSWSYPESFCTNGYGCATPTWPSTYNITQTTATFSWSSVYGAESYTVQLQLPNGYWYDVPGYPIYGTWVTIDILEPCSTYKWRVRSNCSNGSYSYWTNNITFTTQCGSSCHAPYWLYTSNITQSSATLGWDHVYGAYSYSIQYRPAGGTWQDLGGGPWTNNWATIWGLQPGTSYEWRVRSNCYNWSYSEWSYPAYFTTLGYSCSKPSWLSTLNVTQTSATLDWSSVPGAWSYSVQIRPYNGTWTDVPNSPFTQTMATVTGLNPGTTYQWRVRTNCEDGLYSYWTKPVSFTTLGIQSCDAPYWLNTNQITESSANLDWASVPGALSYDLQIRQPGGEWQFIDGGPWTETWFVVTGLQPGTTYEWRVRSKCYASLFSDWSYHVTFTTLGQSCAVPGGLSTTDITDSTATANWSPVSGAISYRVEIRVPNGTWYQAPNSPFASSPGVLTGLIPGTDYYWRVRANCSNGDHSYWTNPVGFTTSGTAISGSDECDNATQLSVNSSCVNSASSNVGATESLPGPLGWCPENEYNDVWFTFTMPDVQNPVVTIRTTAGTLTDAIMEVYRGGGCGDLEYINCEDDNYSGNGSTMPVLTITGSPNETIWVRVWGYAGTTGTFNICVFDYASSDLVVPEDVSENTLDGQPVNPLEKAEYVAKDISTTLHVSPNPTRDVLQVTLEQTDRTKVTRIVLMDLTGKIMYRKDYPVNDVRQFTEQLDVSGFTPEMYLLQVITTSGMLTEKVVVTQ